MTDQENADAVPPACDDRGATCCGQGSARFLIVMLLGVSVAAHNLATRGRSGADAQPVEDAAVRAALAEHDFVYLILPGEAGAANQQAERAVAEAVAKIKASDRSAGILALSRAADNFAALASRFGVAQFPAVVALDEAGGSAVIAGEITQGELVQAYVQCWAVGPKRCNGKVCAPGQVCP